MRDLLPIFHFTLLSWLIFKIAIVHNNHHNYCSGSINIMNNLSLVKIYKFGDNQRP